MDYKEYVKDLHSLSAVDYLKVFNSDLSGFCHDSQRTEYAKKYYEYLQKINLKYFQTHNNWSK